MAAFAIALAIPAGAALVFFTRPPVLIVSDAQFVDLYGASRAKRQQVLASVSLFRRVKPVMVADGASPDMLLVAVTEAAGKPLCVLFPNVYASAAALYHEQYPEIPAVLFAGNADTSGFPDPDDFLSVCRNDTATDLYRAGLMAGVLSGKNNAPDQGQMSVVLLLNRPQDPEKELFAGGVNAANPDLGVVFAGNVSEMPEERTISCVVLAAGAGADHIERKPNVPIIMFTWLGPEFIPNNIMAVFDDSPWALAVPAVRAALKNGGQVKIPSKPLIFSGKIADNGIFRMLEKSAKKTP